MVQHVRLADPVRERGAKPAGNRRDEASPAKQVSVERGERTAREGEG